MKAQIAVHATAAQTRLATTPAAQPNAETSVTQAEVVLWESIENSQNPYDFKSYIQQYPSGAFASLAH